MSGVPGRSKSKSRQQAESGATAVNIGDERIPLLPRRSNSRHAARGRYGSVTDRRPGAFRSTSMPVQASKRVVIIARKARQLTVPEQSAKLAEQAAKKFFHGDFTSLHGAMFLVPPKAPLPKPVQARGQSLSRRHTSIVGGDFTAGDSKKSKPNFDVSVPGALKKDKAPAAQGIFSEPIVLKPRSNSADGHIGDGLKYVKKRSLVQHDTFRESSPDLLTIATMKQKDFTTKKRMLSPTTIRRASDALRHFERSKLDGRSLKNSFDHPSIPLGPAAELAIPDSTPLRLIKEDAKKAVRLAEKMVEEVSASEDYSSDESVDDEDDDEVLVPYSTAVAELLRFAAPAAVAIAFTFSLSVIPLAFIGNTLGERQLTAASVGYFLIAMVVMYPMVGLTFAMDTLCSHEYGRDPKSTQLGVLLQRGIIINLFILAPMCVIIRELKPFFVSTYGESVGLLAMEFLEYVPLFLLPTIVFIAFNKFLSNQMQPHMPMIALTAGVIITPFVQMKLTPMGIKYSMIGMAITAWWQLIVLIIMTLFKEETRTTLGTLRIREALKLSEVKDYLKLAIPSAIFVAAEGSSFDLTILIIARFGEKEGAVWSGIMNAIFIFASFAGGLSAGACAKIGRCIGSYEPNNARRYINISVICATVIALIDSVVIIVFFDFIMSLFGITGSTLEIAKTVKWMLPFFHIADSVQFTFQGIFSGVGRNHWGALILLSSLWGVGIPMCIFLGVYLNLGIVGVCFGLTIGMWIEAPLMIVAVSLFIDYNEVCDEFLDAEWTDEEEEEEEEEDEEEEMSNQTSSDESAASSSSSEQGVVNKRGKVKPSLTSTPPQTRLNSNTRTALYGSKERAAAANSQATPIRQSSGTKLPRGVLSPARVNSSGNRSGTDSVSTDRLSGNSKPEPVLYSDKSEERPPGSPVDPDAEEKREKQWRGMASSVNITDELEKDSLKASCHTEEGTIDDEEDSCEENEEEEEEEMMRRSGITRSTAEFSEYYSKNQRRRLLPPTQKKKGKKNH